MEFSLASLLIGTVFGALLAGALVHRLLLKRLRQAFDEREASQKRLSNLENELDSRVKSLELEAKEEALKWRGQMETELSAKRQALEKLESKLTLKDEQLELRREKLERREEALGEQSHQLLATEQDLISKLESIERELQIISGLDRESAVDLYLQRIESEFKEIAVRKAREIESLTVAQAEQMAKSVVLGVMERCSLEYLNEATVAVISLPSEDIKGRLIGREGRNIRAFEQVAGVDLLIDDTPETVVISCFDPVRRETARLALMNLIVDGRIHPSRIEEAYEKAETEIRRMIAESGDRAAVSAGVAGLPPRIIEMMGHLRFRTSYAQNVLDHSVEVAHLAAMLAAELGFNVEIARQAGFLHDIGKALGSDWSGPHALSGMEFLGQQGVKSSVLHAVGAHHRDIEPTTSEAVIVIIADSLSAARPGARRENLENYVKRLSALEALADSFPGVERSYALQAGREIRLIVRPDKVDDLGASRLASEVARRIESEMEYPGQIKVTVIRETRAQDLAK